MYVNLNEGANTSRGKLNISCFNMCNNPYDTAVCSGLMKLVQICAPILNILTTCFNHALNIQWSPLPIKKLSSR